MGALGTWGDLGVFLALLGLASLGAIAGGTLGGRATGLSWRESGSLGVLLNTRGLMELVVLNIGLDLGLLSPALFTVMVLVALVTTVATTPLLKLVRPRIHVEELAPSPAGGAVAWGGEEPEPGTAQLLSPELAQAPRAELSPPAWRD